MTLYQLIEAPCSYLIDDPLLLLAMLTGSLHIIYQHIASFQIHAKDLVQTPAAVTALPDPPVRYHNIFPPFATASPFIGNILMYLFLFCNYPLR